MSGNNTLSVAPATLTVVPAPLTVTAADASRPVNAPNPVFTSQVVGLVNGDTVDNLGTVTLTAGSGAGSGVGEFSIVPGGLSSPNYAIRYVPGTLTASPVGLSATLVRTDGTVRLVVHRDGQPYSADVPAFEVGYDGEVTLAVGDINGDGAQDTAGQTHLDRWDSLHDLEQELVVPGGHQPPGVDTPFGVRSFEEGYGHPPDHRSVGPGVPGPGPALALPEGHIQNPMQAALDPPAASHPVPQLRRRPPDGW